ncbi:serine/threonine protein kinase [Fischerella muscicola CCMEE 5323]|uniref:Serine/threonine protein kinase n=1 Tax=Fischerella muscicola CCMEE 5323 TaxID=2019572 RepID=A0A2N6K3K8_FISMU|nr:serine/threonine protein kinase [Fischerella sp. FACHB-380]PLZ90175.1 serine/threonine protein kinase [Fischerella muscicola CCMEE 5323]
MQGRYTVVEKLGKGGFGTTFAVDDRGTRKVLKVLTDDNSKAIELFQQEAQVLSQLQCAGIPKVDPDGYFTVLPNNSSVPLHCLVMEKIEGVDLEKWMKSRHCQPISQTQAFDWLKQLVNILSVIHNQQYFHRDIKPQNIMLRPNGQLVLIDFGAVRQVTTTILEGVCHTRIVSKGYSPPEQQNGYSVQQSDFFALGRTFVFLLTGKEPQDLAIYNPLTNQLDWRPHALQISPLFADLIDCLMAPVANQRPENTQVIWQWLEKIEQDINQTDICSQKTLLQTLPKSALSFATTMFSHPSQTDQKTWKLFLGSGVGLIAAVTALINPISTKNSVPTTKPSVLTPSKVSIVNQKSQQTRDIKPSATVVAKNAAIATQLQVKQKKSQVQPQQELQANLKSESKLLKTANTHENKKNNLIQERKRSVILQNRQKIKSRPKKEKTELNVNRDFRTIKVITNTLPSEKTPTIVIKVQKSKKLLVTQNIRRKTQTRQTRHRIKVKLKRNYNHLKKDRK